MKRIAIGILLLLSLLPPQTRAQEEESKSPVERPIEQPITLNGQRPFLNIKSESRQNLLSTGVGFETIFDDNALLTTPDRHSNLSHVLLPYLNATHSTPRLSWDVGVTAMLVNNRQLKTENTAEENLKLNFSYRLAPYLNLRLSSELANTSGLFSALNSGSAGSGIGLAEEANNSLLIPANQRIITSSSLAELSDQISPRAVLGVRGIYSLLTYPDLATQPQFGSLYDNHAYAGEAFYNYQLSEKQWAGVMLRTQKFDTESRPSIRADSALLFYALNATPNITLSFFAGPERFNAPQLSDLATPIRMVRNQQWTPALGATFVWQGKKTGVLGEFSHQITDAGGLSLPVIAYTTNIQLRRRLTSRQELDFNFIHSRADLLSTAERSFGSFATARFQQQVTRGLTAQIGYAREWQKHLDNEGSANANLVWISLYYGITRPFGR